MTPKKINTNDLLKMSDIVLTGRGTVGIEAACLGKKPILAGRSFYSSLGFTFNPKNLNEYKKLILNKNSNHLHQVFFHFLLLILKMWFA